LADLDAARQSIKASVLLSAGNFVSTAISAITAIVIARLLGPDLYGVYALCLAPQAVFLLLAGIGINVSITRFSAYHISRGEIDIAKRKTFNSILFLLLLGILLTIISYVSAPLISNLVLHRTGITTYVQLASFTILGQVMLQASTAAFVGWASSEYAAVSNSIQAFSKAAISISLLVSGVGLYGAVLGHASSYLIAGIFGVGCFFILRLEGKKPLSFRTFLSDIKSQIRFGIPSEFGTYLNGFVSTYFIVILLSGIATNVVIGSFQAANTFSYIISLLTNSIAYALFPAFSFLEGRKSNLSSAFRLAVKYVSFVIGPVIVFLGVFSDQLVRSIYGNQYSLAAPYLTLIAIGFLPVVIGLGTFTPFFDGAGKTRFSMIANLSAVPVILVLAPILGVLYGVYGLIYAIILSDVVTCIAGLGIASKYLSASVDYKSSILIVIVATVSAFASYFLIQMLRLGSVQSLLLEAILCVFLYLTISPLARSIDAEDIARIKIAAPGMGVVSKIIDLVLRYESYLIRVTRGNSKVT
jgi:O-antigen/teichoic acid export membrane protein